MKQSLFPWALLAWLLGHGLSAAGAQPVEDAKQWLERMIQSAQNLNYEGTFIYVQGPHVEAMRTIHGGGPGQERQRLISLTGPVREMLITSSGIISLLPKQHATLLGNGYRHSRFPMSIPRELGGLENQYSFTLEGKDRVAGVEARVVTIKPRDSFRYGYRLWLDQRNGMLLRSALLDDKGYPIEQLMFTDLQIKPHVDETSFKLPASPATTESPSSPPSSIANLTPLTGTPIEQSAWSVTRLPEGFVKILHHSLAEAAAPHPTEQMVFADGLATVSVFVERLAGTAPLLQGESQFGSMNAYGVQVDDYQVLVVGEVPATTVKTIATAVSYDANLARKLAVENKR